MPEAGTEGRFFLGVRVVLVLLTFATVFLDLAPVVLVLVEDGFKLGPPDLAAWLGAFSFAPFLRIVFRISSDVEATADSVSSAAAESPSRERRRGCGVLLVGMMFVGVVFGTCFVTAFPHSPQ